MLSIIIIPLGILLSLLLMPFALVKITELESYKGPRINRAVAFYRRYPKTA